MKSRFKIGETVVYRPTPNVLTFHKVVKLTKHTVTLRGIRSKRLSTHSQCDPRLNHVSILVLRASKAIYSMLNKKQLGCIQNDYCKTWTNIKYQRNKLVQFIYPNKSTIICSFEKVENILSHHFDKNIYKIRMTNITVYNPHKS